MEGTVRSLTKGETVFVIDQHLRKYSGGISILPGHDSMTHTVRNVHSIEGIEA